MSLLEQLEVVRRLLSAMGEGEELQHAGEKQSIALCVAFQRVKTLNTDEKLDLIVAIEGLRMGSTAKDRLLAQVRGKCEATSRKRPLQDYVSWPNFCTPLVWRGIRDNPELATEILCQHLNSLGLILPSKDTEKSIAAHAIAGEYGKLAASVSEEDATRVFNGVGRRIKQLYKIEPSEFIAKLPPSPAAFLKLHPKLAKAVFSRENLPCACPLDRLIVSHAESKIRCRGGDLSASSPPEFNQGFMRQMVCMMGNLHRMVQTPRQTGELALLPPGSLFQQASPGATRFQLLEEAVVPTTPEKKASEFPALSPPACLALLDVANSPKVIASASAEGDLMRASILKGRRELATDRAAATADAKAAAAGATALAKAVAKPLKSKTPAKPLKSKTTPMKRPASCMKRPASCMTKPPSWIEASPFGCSKCRNMPGCTRSCYIHRGVKVPE